MQLKPLELDEFLDERSDVSPLGSMAHLSSETGNASHSKRQKPRTVRFSPEL
jgi:hypothetical protein